MRFGIAILSILTNGVVSHPVSGAKPNPQAGTTEMKVYSPIYTMTAPELWPRPETHDPSSDYSITLQCQKPGPQCMEFPPGAPPNETITVRVFCATVRVKHHHHHHHHHHHGHNSDGNGDGNGDGGDDGGDDDDDDGDDGDNGDDDGDDDGDDGGADDDGGDDEGDGAGDSDSDHDSDDDSDDDDDDNDKDGAKKTAHELRPSLMDPCPEGTRCHLSVKDKGAEDPSLWIEDENGEVPGLKNVDLSSWTKLDDMLVDDVDEPGDVVTLSSFTAADDPDSDKSDPKHSYDLTCDNIA